MTAVSVGLGRLTRRTLRLTNDDTAAARYHPDVLAGEPTRTRSGG